MEKTNKNKNDSVGNFVIYALLLFRKIIKIGKADADRITAASGTPTRVHQQTRKLIAEHGQNNVLMVILQKMLGATTKQAKENENNHLQDFYDKNGRIPEGNQKSFKPKKP